jgi:hypothetical protein
VLVVPEASFADTVSTRASESDLLLLPWSETGGMSEQTIIEDKGTKNKLVAPSYITFVNEILHQSRIPVAILVNKNFGGSKNKDKKSRAKLHRTISTVSLASTRDKEFAAPIADRSHHIFFPFFGGEDDKTALRLVLQLAENPEVTATVVRFDVPGEFFTQTTSDSAAPPIKGASTTVTSSPPQHDHDATFFASIRASLPTELVNRVIFETFTCPTDSPLKDVLARASIELGQNPKNAGDLVVLGRNIGNHAFKLGQDGDKDEIAHASVTESLGVLAERMWEFKSGASLLVVKAGVQ